MTQSIDLRELLFSSTRLPRQSGRPITADDVKAMRALRDRDVSIELAAVAVACASLEQIHLLLRDGEVEDPENHPVYLLKKLPYPQKIMFIPRDADRTAWSAWLVCLHEMNADLFPQEKVLRCWKIALEGGITHAHETFWLCRDNPRAYPRKFAELSSDPGLLYLAKTQEDSSSS